MILDNVAIVMLASIGVLAAGFLVYSRFVERVLGTDAARATPAFTRSDGIDYVPTHPVVLFGHHFAAIAAAGPIVGPTLALMFGFLPTWLWIVLGVVLVGAVHDFVALFISIREGGRSVAEIARRTLGPAGFLLYASFAIVLCILVSAAFLDLTAKSLAALYPLASLGLPADQTILRTATVGGVEKARIGGIASTSLVLITLVAPFFGWVLHRRRPNPWLASVVALALCGASIYLGFFFPIELDPRTWIAIVLVYLLLAGFLPIWVLLQPRDFVNVQLLYLGLVVLVVAVIGCGLHGARVDVPLVNLDEAATIPSLGAVWPFLFVCVACGSVSGAHGLICGGTTCKQISNERHARTVAYGGMLLEALLAICVILVIAAGLGFAEYRDAVWRAGSPGAPVAFAVAIGRGIWIAVGSPEDAREVIAYGTVFGIILLEGFLVTTIDAIVRLSRYLLQEILATYGGDRLPIWVRHPLTLTLVVLAPVTILAYSNGYLAIWPLFGAANQLLAALTLIAASLWLHRHGRSSLITAIPAALMTATTIAALVFSLGKFLGVGRDAAPAWPLAAATAVLLALATGVVAVAVRRIAALRFISTR